MEIFHTKTFNDASYLTFTILYSLSQICQNLTENQENRRKGNWQSKDHKDKEGGGLMREGEGKSEKNKVVGLIKSL